jgi:hypothetical protein
MLFYLYISKAILSLANFIEKIVNIYDIKQVNMLWEYMFPNNFVPNYRSFWLEF